MKTFDKKDVFTCVNAEDAKQYIGKEGYLSDTLINLQNRVNNNILETLDDIHELQAYPFFANGLASLLFLPADKVKEIEKEKKWRAFKDIGEFQCVTNKFIGDIIEVKSDWDGRAYRCLIMWATEGYIGMAGLRFSLLIDLFEHYQWKDSNNEWQPFGVLENES